MSLQDQLLKAGLVNQKQAKKAKKSSKKSRTLRKEIKEVTESKKAEQLAKDQAANEQIKQQAQQKAIIAQIKQLIEMNAIATSTRDDAVDYKFTDESKIKTVRVDDKQHAQLAKGVLAIARYESSYKVIPAIVADKIAQRDEQVIVMLNTKDESSIAVEDDPYADFQIPDDLMW